MAVQTGQGRVLTEIQSGQAVTAAVQTGQGRVAAEIQTGQLISLAIQVTQLRKEFDPLQGADPFITYKHKPNIYSFLIAEYVIGILVTFFFNKCPEYRVREIRLIDDNILRERSGAEAQAKRGRNG